MGHPIFGFRDAGRYVYHYTSATTAKKHILPKCELRANCYQLTNDPKERNCWQFDFCSNHGLDPIEHRLSELSNRFSDALKAKIKVMCFSRDSEPLTGDHTKDICKRGFAKPRMWAQYGDDHRGLCLIFDKQELRQSIKAALSPDDYCYEGNVTYVDRPFMDRLDEGDYKIEFEAYENLGLQQYAAEHVRKYHRRLFFEKVTDWSQETEFRWVIFSGDDSPREINYGNSLVGIIFGWQTSADDIAEIMALGGTDVMYTALIWKNCGVWYDLAPPEFG